MIQKVCLTAGEAREAILEIIAHGRAGGLLLADDSIAERTIGFSCSGGGRRWAFPVSKIKERVFSSVFKEWLDTVDSRKKVAHTANRITEEWFKKEGKTKPKSCTLCLVGDVMES